MGVQRYPIVVLISAPCFHREPEAGGWELRALHSWADLEATARGGTPWTPIKTRGQKPTLGWTNSTPGFVSKLGLLRKPITHLSVTKKMNLNVQLLWFWKDGADLVLFTGPESWCQLPWTLWAFPQDPGQRTDVWTACPAHSKCGWSGPSPHRAYCLAEKADAKQAIIKVICVMKAKFSMGT